MNTTLYIKRTGLLLWASLLAGIALAQQNPYPDSSRYRISPVAVNTELAEWGAFAYNGSVIFSSNRHSPRPSHLVHRTDKQTGADFYALYSATLNANGGAGKVELFANELDSRFNVGPIYITPNGNTLIVTHNVEKKSGTLKDNGKREYVLQLVFYSRDAKRSRWRKDRDFQYNSSAYSCAHAFMTPDGQRLFFSSDMPGTLGGMDIFVCNREEAGWGKPQNVGKQVNSGQNEIFPSVSSDGRTLYFSSDRAGGLGGLDIYQVALPLTDAGTASNMGVPVNTPYDDFGLVLYDKKQGFLSSNRPLEINGRADASDNIYRLLVSPPTKLYNLTVVDSFTQKPIAANISYRCLDCDGDTLPQHSSVVAGGVLKNIPLTSTYRYEVIATADGFPPHKQLLIPTEENTDVVLNATLRSLVKGTVVDQEGVPVADAIVTITDNGGKVYRYTANRSGGYTSDFFAGGSKLEVAAADAGMVSRPVTIDLTGRTARQQPEYTANFTLYFPEKMALQAGVLFEFDKYSLTAKAKNILDKLSKAMLRQPDVTVVLSGHTDSRGASEYNQVLSSLRAKAVRSYLVGKGVKSSRIKVEAYGYSRLINKCGKGVPCTELEHQENRRVEFVFSKKLEVPQM